MEKILGTEINIIIIKYYIRS